MEENKKHYCYILFDKQNHTYNGYTNNLCRRLRQHNKEIKGGAKYTGKKQTMTQDPCHWKYMLYITSSDERFDHRKALSLEWSIKNPTNRRTKPKRTPIGRIESLPLVFQNKKFQDFHFDLVIHETFFAPLICKYLENIPNVYSVNILRMEHL